ncbi:hypothetical protein [Jannaschia formosa]|uniref:hypothetical protein n=1 Tax=Jannaschia formosa TaxID=2259592 RepID=UPI000E1C23F7|nr:hypothetical protein [Jannaschia formosa]TFL19348.1 hypothetical protein DR046_05330 [Jannaschia formosa]
MAGTARVTLRLRGRFRVVRSDGTDLTPTRRKEAAILALLACAPERMRTRSWLRGILWSDRAPEQALTSFRRALSNLRKQLGPDADILDTADPQTVALRPWVGLDRGAPGGEAELLETLDGIDPALDDWLRDLRCGDDPAPRRPGARASLPERTSVEIVVQGRPREIEADYLTAALADHLASRFAAEGVSDIYRGTEPVPAAELRGTRLLRIELSAGLGDARNWTVQLRAMADAHRRFVWSGSVQLPMDLREISEGHRLPAFASTAIAQISARLRAWRLTDRSGVFALQAAAARLFTGDKEQLRLAEAELAALSSGDALPLALAWRAFAGLTRSLEFIDRGETAAEAAALAEEAFALRPDNPVIASLAARVALELVGDTDRAAYLADAGLRACDRNPYALYAAAQVALISGEASKAHRLAQTGRLTAEGLPNAYAWDMEVCLTALGVSDVDLAHKSARAAHAKARSFRPALRYLVALDLIRDDVEAAHFHARQLAEHEPGFRISHLTRPDYPLMTLRKTGYGEALVGI